MMQTTDVTLLDTVMDGDVFNNGIFTYIKNSLTVVPDYMQDITVLNQDYYYRHSGSKSISSLVRHFLDDNDKLTNDGCYSLARIIINDYKSNWDKVYKALTIDYSPIENYDANEDSTDTRSHTSDHTGTDGTTHTGTDTTEHTGTDGTTHKGTDTTANTGTDTTTDDGTIGTVNSIKDGSEKTINGIAGFNNDDDFSKDTSSTKTVNQTVNNNETRKLSGSTKYGKTETTTIDTTDNTTYNTTQKSTLDTSDNTTYNSTIKETDSTTHTLHRHGNIGVTTSQQMIEAELVLRRKNFFDIVFADLDRLLTLSIY